MPNFWSPNINLRCHCFCFPFVSAPPRLGCLRKSSQPNLSTFYSLSLSLYFHHLLFHHYLPLLLTFPFPPDIPGCCCCWLSKVSIFLLPFCFLTNIVFYLIVSLTLTTLFGADFIWTAIVPCPILFDLNCINALRIYSWSQILGKDCHLLCACAIACNCTRTYILLCAYFANILDIDALSE